MPGGAPAPEGAPEARATGERSRRRSGDVTLQIIAVFKLVKGLVLLTAGVGLLGLLKPDVAEAVAGWALQLHEHRHLNRALAALLSLDPARLRAVSAGTFGYAALLLTEGIGLLLRKRWAEYFTVIITTSFIPLEIYELAHHVTPGRLALLGVNVAVVVYLLVRLLRRPEER